MAASTKDEVQGRSRGRIGWLLAWALSVVLAFILGHQMGSGQGGAAGTRPAATPATSASPAATPEPTPDPEVLDLLRKLPRRDANDPLAKGAVDAKVVLTEWSDFRCPYCARWATETLPELEPFVADGTLRIEYRDLAVLGEESTGIAIAARAAGQQGKFWEFSDATFKALAAGEQPTAAPVRLLETARTAGVPDLPRFEADLADPALREAVLADSQHAQQLGITGTPFFIIDTTVINGAQPTAEFIAAIQAHAAD